jgi:hypothetical protein
VVLTRISVIPKLKSVITTRTSRISHECDHYTHDCDFNTHKSDFYTQSAILTRMSLWVWFWHSRVWLRHAWAWLIHALVEFQPDACDSNTNQLKLRLPKNSKLGLVLTSGYTTRTSVIFTSCVWYWHLACDFGTLRVILAPCVWFEHSTVWFWHAMKVLVSLFKIFFYHFSESIFISSRANF